MILKIAYSLALLSVLATASHAQDAQPSASIAPAAAAVPVDPGLSRHDFFYAGEAKTRDMYIVRHGEITWSYHDPTGRGEISDAVLLSNGNILFAHQFGVTLISPDKKILWNLDAPPKFEIHTAQPIGVERVLYIQNGEPAKVAVVNIVTGQVEKEFTPPVKNPKNVHGQFRHARLTDAGTLLVAHMDANKVSEYDTEGKEVWSVDAGASPWSASRLKNGNTLICGSRFIREVKPSGETAWEFTPTDAPDSGLASLQIATRLPNGNTLVNNWVNQWNGTVNPDTAPAQAVEIAPDKRVVWALRAWHDPANLGPATTIQLLDEPGTVPEAVHFGAIN